MLREYQINMLIERIKAGRKPDATGAEVKIATKATEQLLSAVRQYRAFASLKAGRVADAVNLKADTMLADAGLTE